MNNLDDIVKYFVNGLRELHRNSNPHAARQNFEYVLNLPGGSEQCDVWRALACLRQTASPLEVERMRDSVTTFGALLARAGLDDSTLAAARFTVPFCGMDHALNEPSHVRVAAAMRMLEQGERRNAVEALAAAVNPSDEMAIFFRAVVEHDGRRWSDIVESGRALLAANDRKGDVVTGQAAHYFLGVGFAHLGNNAAAAQNLERVTQSQGGLPSVSAHAWRIIGLMARNRGDEDEANAALAQALIWLPEDTEIIAALHDPNVRLRTTTAELIGKRTDPWDPETEPSPEAEHARISDEGRARALVEARETLDAQIGMEAVKRQVRALRATAFRAAELKKRGIDTPGSAMHMAFVGPPGTGKTTIANVVAKIFYGLGVCRLDNLVVAGKNDIVGEHLGETPKKANALIDKAMGGVLFIDEAYTIVQEGIHGGDAFGNEAIDTLLARMENDRDDLVVIIAGYEGKINSLLASNDGLASRFSRRIRFDSYTADEVGRIFEHMVGQRKEKTTESAVATLVAQTLSSLMLRNKDDVRYIDLAGNGRYVRNVVEKAEEYLSLRIEDADGALLSDDEILTIEETDVAQAVRDVIEPVLRG